MLLCITACDERPDPGETCVVRSCGSTFLRASLGILALLYHMCVSVYCVVEMGEWHPPNWLINALVVPIVSSTLRIAQHLLCI